MFNSSLSKRFRLGSAVGAAAVVAGSLALLAQPSSAATPAPIGHLDSVVVHGGTVTLTGWAAGLDTPRSSIDVRAVFTPDPGMPGSPSSTARIAHDPRPDVAAAHPELGPNHGFSFSVDTYQAIRTTVCLYGLDLHGGPDGKLGCQTLTLAQDHPAFGHLDSVKSVGNLHIEIRGWGADPDTPTTPTSVNLLLGGGPNQAYNIVPAKASLPRPDVARVYPSYGPNHGFDVTVAAKPGTYPVCSYVFDTQINRYGGTPVGCITVTVP